MNGPSLWDEWDGMPEFVQKDRRPVQRIVVNFATRADVEAFAALVGYTLSEKSRSIWFPFKDRTNAAAYEYRDDGGGDAIPR